MKSVKSLFIFLLLGAFAYGQIPPPENLTAVAAGFNNSAVKLTWDQSSTTTVKFYVYKKDAPADDTTKLFRKIAFVHHKEFTDFHLITGNTYSYYVKTVTNAGVSEPSNIVEFTKTAPVYTYGTINGFVTTDTTLAALVHAKVHLIPKFSLGGTTGNVTAFVYTDSMGFFSGRVKTGDYVVYVSAAGHFGEYFDNVRYYSQATIITVAESDSLILNIGLASITPPVLYNVTGTVKDAAGLVAKMANITAFVKNRVHSPHGGFGNYNARTDSNGNFSVKAKPGDTLALFARPLDNTFMPEYWDGKANINEADLIVVNANVTDINFTLELKPVYANSVTGTVSDSLGTTGLKGYVYLLRKDATTPSPIHHRRKYWAPTDSLTGAYSFENVEPGQYLVLATARYYKATYFKYDGTHTLDWRQADSVVVTADGVVGNINFNLYPFVHPFGGNASVVFGTTLESDGVLAEGVLTYISDAEGNVVSASVSDPAGTFAHEGLVNGYYQITANSMYFNDASVSGILIEEESNSFETNLSLTPEGVTSIKGNTIQPDKFTLQQNYPNPFNPSTVISFGLPEASAVTLRVYNIIGQEVAILLNNELRTAGHHEVSFDASNLSNGIYIYRIEAAGISLTKKMTLLK